jgi:hypothetical protein
MTASELRTALKQLEISQMELARRLKVAPTTARRWVSRTNPTPIPHYVDIITEHWKSSKTVDLLEALEQAHQALGRTRRLDYDGVLNNAGWLLEYDGVRFDEVGCFCLGRFYAHPRHPSLQAMVSSDGCYVAVHKTRGHEPRFIVGGALPGTGPRRRARDEQEKGDRTLKPQELAKLLETLPPRRKRV